MPRENLTPKQARFVDEYLIDLNATQAAIRAGYALKGAEVTASKLLRVPKVEAAINTALTARSQETKIDAAWVLKRLAAEAEADIADIYDDHGNLLPVKQWPKIWRQGLVQGIEVEELFEGRGEDRVQIGVLRKVKLDSRIKRTELIGKHVKVNAFQETVNHTGLDAIGDRLERALKRIG
jgi:phage terminase small subunit